MAHIINVYYFISNYTWHTYAYFDFLKQPTKHIKLKYRMTNNDIGISDLGYLLLYLRFNFESCMLTIIKSLRLHPNY